MSRIQRMNFGDLLAILLSLPLYTHSSGWQVVVTNLCKR
jgi:hypothetical protein